MCYIAHLFTISNNPQATTNKTTNNHSLTRNGTEYFANASKDESTIAPSFPHKISPFTVFRLLFVKNSRLDVEHRLLFVEQGFSIATQKSIAAKHRSGRKEVSAVIKSQSPARQTFPSHQQQRCPIFINNTLKFKYFNLKFIYFKYLL